MHRVLILAQGNGSRWNDLHGRPYLDVPKHLVRVNGETVIGRCERLFARWVDDVIVIGPDDDRYREALCGKYVTLAEPHPTGTVQDEYLATQELWSTAGRTTIVYGDCWYSDEAAEVICSHSGEGIHYFRRPGASRVTGHRWDEGFATSFSPADHVRVVDSAQRVVEAVENGLLKSDHCYHHYAVTLGFTDISSSARLVPALRNTPGQTRIDDWTDDFDHPFEYREWLSRRWAADHPRASAFGARLFRLGATVTGPIRRLPAISDHVAFALLSCRTLVALIWGNCLAVRSQQRGPYHFVKWNLLGLHREWRQLREALRRRAATSRAIRR